MVNNLFSFIPSESGGRERSCHLPSVTQHHWWGAKETNKFPACYYSDQEADWAASYFGRRHHHLSSAVSLTSWEEILHCSSGQERGKWESVEEFSTWVEGFIVGSWQTQIMMFPANIYICFHRKSGWLWTVSVIFCLEANRELLTVLYYFCRA